jgi:hypothetical protein
MLEFKNLMKMQVNWSMGQSPSRDAEVLQQGKKFSILCGDGHFVTMFTKTGQLSLS